MTVSLIALWQQLCEIDPPEISRQWINRHESRDSIEALISCGALVPAENASLVLCERCDDEHWIVPEYVGPAQYRAFCAITGYHHLSPEALRGFAVDDSWIASCIAAALGIRPAKSQVDRPQPLLCLGRARFGPYPCELFFGRRLYDRSRLERALAIVTGKAGSGPNILLTSTKPQFLSSPMPERCAVIGIENVLTLAHGETSFDEAPILAALRGPTRSPREGGIGFCPSFGFQICLYGSKSFRFSKKQALAIQVLHDAWNRGFPGVEQDELQGQIETSQRVAQLFHRHPAYGDLIQNDGKGLYWLNL